MRLQRVALCPEIRLWLLGPEVDLEACCWSLAEAEPPPFWAFCWGGGQALARYVLNHPEEVRGLRVADLGTGCGVAAIAAALAGAGTSIGVDIDPQALEATRANAEANAVRMQVSTSLPDEADVVLACDVIYEAENLALLRRAASSGSRVLVGDPERSGGPRLADASLLARMDVRTQPDVDSPMRSAAVFELGLRPARLDPRG